MDIQVKLRQQHGFKSYAATELLLAHNEMEQKPLEWSTIYKKIWFDGEHWTLEGKRYNYTLCRDCVRFK